MLKIHFKTAFLGMVFLGTFSTALTSCSSSDDERESTEQNTDGRKLRQLTINDVPITRATLTDNTNSLGAYWNAGDEATYLNLSSYLLKDLNFSTLISSEEAEKATFTGNVRCMDADKIALFYPATVPSSQSSDWGTFAIDLNGQKGTLRDIATNYHYVYGVGQISTTTENPATATATISSMKSLLAVCKFTFEDNVTNAAIPVKTLTINYGNDGVGYPVNGTVTPSSNTANVVATPTMPNWEGPLIVNLSTETSNGVYVALFPVSTTSTLHFTVTNSAGTYTGTATAKLNAGRYYPVTLKLAEK